MNDVLQDDDADAQADEEMELEEQDQLLNRGLEDLGNKHREQKVIFVIYNFIPYAIEI